MALHLIDEGSHAIDASIARGDDHYGLPLLCQLEGLLSTLTLLLHARIDTLTVLAHIRLDELKIILIAHHHIGTLKRLTHSERHISLVARS